MSQGGHSEQFLFFALFYQSTPSCLKVIGGVGGMTMDVFSVQIEEKSKFLDLLTLHFVKQCLQIEITSISDEEFGCYEAVSSSPTAWVNFMEIS